MKKEDLKVGLQVTTVTGANGEIVEVTEDKVFVSFAIDYVNEAPMEYSMSYFLKVFTLQNKPEVQGNEDRDYRYELKKQIPSGTLIQAWMLSKSQVGTVGNSGDILKVTPDPFGKRLSHCPFTAESRVRISYGSHEG